MLPLQEEGEEEAEEAGAAAAASTPSSSDNNNKNTTNPARALGAALARLRLTPSPTGGEFNSRATASRRKSRLGGSEKEEAKVEEEEKEEEDEVASSSPLTTTTAAPPPPLSPLHRLLRVCGQEHERAKLPSMDSLLARHVCLAGVAKCGEGTFGEAFRCRGGAVVKVVPFVAGDADAAAILAEAARRNEEWEAAVASGNATVPSSEEEDDDIIDDGVIKTAAELLAEAEIGLALTALASGVDDDENDENAENSKPGSTAPPNATSGFCATRAVGVCSGPYSETLAAEWDSWRRRNGTENLRPRSRAGDPRVLHAVFVADDGGADLEAALLRRAGGEESVPLLRGPTDVVSLLAQVTGALAAAEGALRFEHRDLHWGNVLLRRTDEVEEEEGEEETGEQTRRRRRRGTATAMATATTKAPTVPRCLLRVGGRAFALREDAARLRVRLIDFTLSRCDSEAGAAAAAAGAGGAATSTKAATARGGGGGRKQQHQQPPASYCDLSSDPLLFQGPKGDPQSETYRAMAKVSRGDWQGFHPGTNALWVSYLAGVLLGSAAAASSVAAAPAAGSSSSAGGNTTSGDTVRLLRGFKRRAAGAPSARALLEDELFKGVWEEVAEG